MASAADIRAGGGYVELYAKTEKLGKGLTETKSQVKTWAEDITKLGVGFTALGSAITAPLVYASKAFADQGGLIDDISQRTGASAEAIAGLQYAAERSGTSLDDVTAGFRKMTAVVDGALTGQQASVDLLQQLGVSLDQVRGKRPEEIFSLFADRIASISDPIHRAIVATDLFGKAGGNLIPLLSNGAAGIAHLRKEASDLGLVMSGEDVAAAAEFGDALDRTWAAVRGLTVTIGGALAPSLQAGVDLFVSLSKHVREFISENQGVIVAVAATGVAVLGLGAGLTALGLSITFIGTALIGLKSAFLLFSVVALSPITWLVAAGIAVVGVLGYVTGAFSEMSTLLNTVVDGATTMIQGVANAIRAGDLTAAWAIVTTTLEIGWIQTSNYIMNTWDSVVRFFARAFSGPLQFVADGLSFVQEVFTEVAGGAFRMVDKIVTAISEGNIVNVFSAITDAISDVWTATINYLSDAWDAFAGFVSDALAAPLKAITTELAAFAKELRDITGIDVGVKALQELDSSMTGKPREKLGQGTYTGFDFGEDTGPKTLREQREDSLKEARDRLQELLKKVAPPEVRKTLAPVPELASSVSSKEVNNLKDDIVGTFSGRGVQGIAGGSQQKALKAAEETAKNTKKIADKPGLIFGT